MGTGCSRIQGWNGSANNVTRWLRRMFRLTGVRRAVGRCWNGKGWKRRRRRGWRLAKWITGESCYRAGMRWAASLRRSSESGALKESALAGRRVRRRAPELTPRQLPRGSGLVASPWAGPPKDCLTLEQYRSTRATRWWQGSGPGARGSEAESAIAAGEGGRPGRSAHTARWLESLRSSPMESRWGRARCLPGPGRVIAAGWDRASVLPAGGLGEAAVRRPRRGAARSCGDRLRGR